MIRENFLLNIGKADQVRLTSEEKAFSQKFSSFISKKNIAGIADELNLASNHIEANGYARIVFLDMSLKLSRLIRLY
jgi:DNA polymerase-3 subunit delta'